MTPVTHMPLHDFSRLPVALFGGPDDPTGGEAGGGKRRPAKIAKKGAKKAGSKKASKKSGSKRR